MMMLGNSFMEFGIYAVKGLLLTSSKSYSNI